VISTAPPLESNSRRAVDQLDGEVARPAEQRAKRGIAVEAREAAPDDGAFRVDQRRDRSIADEGEIERAHWRLTACWSQARTAATLRKRNRAAVGPGPTLIE